MHTSKIHAGQLQRCKPTITQAGVGASRGFGKRSASVSMSALSELYKLAWLHLVYDRDARA